MQSSGVNFIPTWYYVDANGNTIRAEENRPADYRFGLQWRIGSSRVYLETRADTQEAADALLRDQALGLAAKLEEWAKDPYRQLTPYQTPDGGDLYLVGGEG